MSPCPTEPELRAFLCGAAPAAAQAAVGTHLDDCPACLERLSRLDPAADPLVGALRGAAPDQTGVLEPAVLKLLGAAAKGPAPVGPGDRVGPYLLLEKIGEGGMGAVYKARHDRLGKVFALKLLPPGRHDDPARAARFAREARAAGRVEHPHVVRATDAGEHAGIPFLVMELVEGSDLARLVRRSGPLRPADACEAVRQAALALGHAHDRGLVHRDVKPSNLLLTPDGTVKLLDLGLALAADDAPEPPAGAPAGAPTGAGAPALTHTGLALGTRDYMAPEQAADPHGVDARADVYGLGATLHFLLTGHVPGGPGAVPGGLSGVLARMLAEHPADRYATVADVAAALRGWARRHDLAAAATGRPPRVRRRGRWAAATLVGLAAGVSAAVALAPRAPVPVVAPVPEAGAAPLPVAPPPRPARGPAPVTAGQLTAAEAAALQRRWAEFLGEDVVEAHASGVRFALVPPAPAGVAMPHPGRPFRLAAHEVTRGQFRRFVAATGYKTDAETRDGPAFATLGPIQLTKARPAWTDKELAHRTDDHPVTHVSWCDARAYCRWLGTLDGKAYRVPTVAEWVWAGRAGSMLGGYHGPLGEERFVATVAWYAGNAGGGPRPVARLAPNPFGLYDLVGNVAEWAMDRSGPAPPEYRPEADEVEEVYRVVRGGSFRDRFGSVFLSNNSRTDLGGLAATAGQDYSGFRVLRVPE